MIDVSGEKVRALAAATGSMATETAVKATIMVLRTLMANMRGLSAGPPGVK